MSGTANGATVGIVIVSHSPDIAKGTADMVRQMVGPELRVAWCGGNPAGGLGTDVAAILASIDAAWSEAGVVVLVDLGGAEMNSEAAIEMLPDGRREKVVLCDAPIVEGAIMAATQASTGSPLDRVRAAAEELAA
jgi:dihydroxyacetone kinase phosphotransfer subunit